MATPSYAPARSTEAVLATNKVIRNTYTLLSMTLLFSALTAGVSTYLAMPPATYLICLFGAFGLIWFVLPRMANSANGIWVVFAITGLLGFALGPILTMYLSLANGSQIVGTALAGTGAIFLGLSGYALVTRKDFSFLGGFLVTGIIVVLLAAIASIFLAIPALHLTISAAVILLMSGFLLYHTSQMVHDGASVNYLMMTVQLYLIMFNIFISLLHLLGFASGDD